MPSQAVETEHPDFIQNENSNGGSGNDDTVDDDENGNINLTDHDEHLGIDQLDCVTVKLFDGPALAQMIIPKTGKDNLKQQTHDRRGETVGTEISVEG